MTLHLLTSEWDLPEKPESFLDSDEIERMGRFVFEPDARRWSLFRAKAKRALAGHTGGRILPWLEGPGGKPRVDQPGLEFNLSHSETLAALVVSDAGPVGVDLEPLDRAPTLLECEDSFCHPAERAELPVDTGSRAIALLHLWTAKEALLKAVGTGLQFPPTELIVRDDAGIGGPERCDQFHLRRPVDPAEIAHCLAVAVPRLVETVTLA
ncbi:4'-phosphopantetheinyl transferase family protein [Haloferula sp. A504]|uniref:4'-phosphopantetheinyl transferase family protein n=1 Tax=Haloferula sp. A504 TaxID=3373601 RepID=UPI0031CA8567|nr:4'-phosphopantetheinyl transferase superfamily protein [Verrucomicrobiaceae bacterium E54]